MLCLCIFVFLAFNMAVNTVYDNIFKICSGVLYLSMRQICETKKRVDFNKY